MNTILIVDDDSDTRRLLTIVLERSFEVLMASNGEEAVEMAQNYCPDVILMDVAMPKDGLAACRALKALEETQDIPIVFMSGLVTKEDIQRGIEAGAVDYVVKPFDVFALAQRLERLVDEGPDCYS